MEFTIDFCAPIKLNLINKGLALCLSDSIILLNNINVVKLNLIPFRNFKPISLDFMKGKQPYRQDLCGHSKKLINLIKQYQQSWALALFFHVRSPLNFLSMDRYHSIAHFAHFQVRSSLNRSQKDQWFAPGKER